MKIEFSLQIFEKSTNIKFYESPSNGIRDVPCREAERDTDRQTDMTELILRLRDRASC